MFQRIWWRLIWIYPYRLSSSEFISISQAWIQWINPFGKSVEGRASRPHPSNESKVTESKSFLNSNMSTPILRERFELLTSRTKSSDLKKLDSRESNGWEWKISTSVSTFLHLMWLYGVRDSSGVSRNISHQFLDYMLAILIWYVEEYKNLRDLLYGNGNGITMTTNRHLYYFCCLGRKQLSPRTWCIKYQLHSYRRSRGL